MAEEAVSLDTVFARSDRIVGRRIAEEYILVPIVGRGADLDSIYNLNRVGAFIWEHLDGRATGADVVAALTERFQVDEATAAADYRNFLTKLVAIAAVRASN